MSSKGRAGSFDQVVHGVHVDRSFAVAVFAVAGCSGCAAGPAFSPAVKQAWHLDCPEQDIAVKAVREYGGTRIYLLNACGELVEIEERPVFDQFSTMSPNEVSVLRSHLESGVPVRMLDAARGEARRQCSVSLRDTLYEPNGDEVSADILKAKLAACEGSVASKLTALGTDRDDPHRPRYWFAIERSVFVGWLAFGAPSCDHRTLERERCIDL